MAWWDELVSPGSLSETMPIRIVMAAIFAVAFVATLTGPGRRSLGPYMVLHVAVGLTFPLVLMRLPDGFDIGVPGLVLPMLVVPILSTRLWHTVAALTALILLPNGLMAVDGVGGFTVVHVNSWLISGAMLAGALSYLMSADRRRAFAAQLALGEEQRRSQSLLLNILPAEIAERLKRSHASTSDAYAEATVLFADIAGFTDYAESVGVDELVDFLNDLFARFDEAAAERGVEKIKTIGDSYMAVGGVPTPRDDHAVATVELAEDMLRIFDHVCGVRDLDLGLRVGVHSGPLVGGVIGTRKFSYDVWGDTVNVASRMESTGVPGRIQISEATRVLLDPALAVTARGNVEMKHHTPMQAYLLG